MIDIDTLFKRRKVNTERLVAFGFSESKNGYTYATGLIDEQLEMKVSVTKEGKISAEVIDLSSGENYILYRIPSTTGSFVGKVRKEYEGILIQIAENCFEPDVFKSKDAQQIIRYVREKYQDKLEFLWPRFPENAIFRRQDSAKWYAALLIVQKKKLGLEGDGSIEILDLRMKPETIETLVDHKRYFPGYHMNKKHWITICLDGSISVEEIFSLIDESFKLASK